MPKSEGTKMKIRKDQVHIEDTAHDQKVEIEGTQTSPQHIIGIGASAGGLEVLETFFSNIPVDNDLTIVVIQHLSPSHKSIMDSILARYTKMGISVIKDKMDIELNKIYLSPPDFFVDIQGDKFYLTEFEKTKVTNLPIDHFFRSLAKYKGERAICIILSGTGTDGTLGLKAVKENGGMAMVQEESQAKYEGMPRSAIDTGLVDYILPIEKMPDQLFKYIKHPLIELTKKVIVSGVDTKECNEKIFRLIKIKTGHDFSLYKQTTIQRRIERRMALHDIEKLVDYVRYLERSPDEVDDLFKELLIGVTRFFRDPEAFEALALKVLPELLATKEDGGVFRVWVPGCSSGEEAYSLAILLTEVIKKYNKHLAIQIFASDIDSNAIDIARKAIYPENITADITPERLKMFFNQNGTTYQIKKQIREKVVFAIQNVIKDPPFSRLDLISCRNLLIYLEQSLHKQLFPVFNFSLLDHGILFLGTSETVGDSVDYFSVLDSKFKIYAKKGGIFRPNEYPKFPERLSQEVQIGVASTTIPPIRILGAKVISEHYASPSVIVNRKFEVLQIYGDIGRYLGLSSGEASLNVLQIVRDGMRHKLGTALAQALKNNTVVKSENVQVISENEMLTVDLIVQPLSGQGTIQQLLLIVFRECIGTQNVTLRKERSVSVESVKNDEIMILEQELKATKEYLQTTIEELQTTNEELNSTNEEMQSTNEELETSREELQSTNEELITVNSELQNKVTELTQTSNDVNNLLASIDIATLFLDTELRIKRFTPAAVKVFRLISSDIGRPIHDITSKILKFDVYQLAADVLSSLSRQEVDVQIVGNKWYSIKILPYRTIDNIIEGVVLTFIDITELKHTSQQMETAKLLAENIVETIREPFVILDQNLIINSANKQFYNLFTIRPENAINRRIDDLGNGKWIGPQLRNILEKIITTNTTLVDYQVIHEFPVIGKRTILLNGRQLLQTKSILLAIEDITGRIE
jgi:two-component system CheB/CheR fusion protein